jgi:GNAT superfamily N-acetyltransferase
MDVLTLVFRTHDMELTIERIAPEHIVGFHHAVDCVARERKFLAFLEAPPLASTREFVMNNITKGYPQFVALADGTVVGWCDVIPKPRPVLGVLGMGLLPAFRGKGHGAALIGVTLTLPLSLRLCRSE